jgi:hypothetical protein
VEPISIRLDEPTLRMSILGFARQWQNNGALIVLTGTWTAVQRPLLIKAINDAEDAYRGFRGIFPNRLYTRSGGRRSYGPNTLQVYHRAGAIAGKVLSGLSGSKELNTDFEDGP